MKPARHGSASLKARALRLLSQREHSRAELQGKLLRQLQSAARRRAIAARRGAGPGPAADVADAADAPASGDAGDRFDPADPAAMDAVDAAAAAEGSLDAPELRQQLSSLLDELQGHGLLSDERAAASLLAIRAPRHGERRLRHDLQAKGLDPALVAQTLTQARETELPRALALWQRRYGQVADNAADHARQVRFLAGRGFSMDTITRVLRQARVAARDGAEADFEVETDADADAS